MAGALTIVTTKCDNKTGPRAIKCFHMAINFLLLAVFQKVWLLITQNMLEKTGRFFNGKT